ncbi:hypothetical protein G4B88_020333 [Cannabis sativa]|uniref:Uncharacterized protein n=1 Tax=Cannabis sativa TaxID=3483 RepID=A0A7J6EMY8_CANSA|nr:hypothetical protein G4B88_020333 [Cannabis sativa]
MRFIVALRIASLFVDKADSELSFIPRHNLYPCASYLPGVRSKKYSHPYPLTSIPRASYPFSFDHGGEQVKIEKLTLGLGIIRLELMTSTTSRVEKLNATILEQLGVGPSFCTITDTKIMGKIRFNCQLFLSKIGSTTDSSHSTWFHKTVQFSRSK